MTLHLLPAPGAALELIRHYVPILLAADEDDLEEGGLTEWLSALQVSEPYPLYTSTIPDVLENRITAGARHTAWAYIIVRGDAIVALGEVAASDPHGEQSLAFATLHPREYAEFIAQAIARAEQLPQVVERDYELRILRAAGVSLLAIWLHRPDDDLLVPVGTGAPFGDGVFTESALRERLQPLAVQRWETSDL